MAHIECTTRIHAPLRTVWETAHDPRRWPDWYVGISDERELEPAAGSQEPRSLMVGTPFPLTQRVAEDRLEKTEAHWRSAPANDAECASVSRFCKLLLLSSEQSWTYSERDGETEVTAVVDFSVPRDYLDRDEDEAIVETIEADCLDRSLKNLRALCETSPSPGEAEKRGRRRRRSWLG